MRLSDLPLGSKIKFGKYQGIEDEKPEDIIWLIVDKNHEGYPENSCTLMSEYCLDNLIFDYREIGNPDTWYVPEKSHPTNTRSGYGNRRWSVSNICQWLNSDKPAEKWYTPQHQYDMPPNSNVHISFNYYYRPGFLSYFKKQEIEKLLDTTLITALSGSDTNGKTGEKEISINKIFFLSVTEVFNTTPNNNTILEGKYFNFFTNNITKAYPKNNLNSVGWWLRTCSNVDGTNGHGVNYNGINQITFCYATHSNWWIRPCCNISLNNSIIEDSDGTYKIEYSKATKYISYKGGQK